MIAPVRQETLQGPVVRGDLPGPRSAELLAEQLGLLTHGLGFPTPAKDAFTEAPRLQSVR